MQSQAEAGKHIIMLNLSVGTDKPIGGLSEMLSSGKMRLLSFIFALSHITFQYHHNEFQDDVLTGLHFGIRSLDIVSSYNYLGLLR